MLELKNINKSYFGNKGLFAKERLKVLNNISLKIREGECLGLIGKSGSGKSTLGKIILGLEGVDSGEMQFYGKKDRSFFQKDLSIVFQDYTSSVNSRFTVKQIISEPLRRDKHSKIELDNRVKSLLVDVGLDGSYINRYPYELSGGQLQRVCIARAIATNPKFIVLDEAVSSLDASVQLQVLELLINLKKQYNLSYLFITHDLLTITYICNRVLFLKEGSVVEEVTHMKSLGRVKHEYAKSLLKHV